MFKDENLNTVFLWLCPGTRGLEKQLQESFGISQEVKNEG